jgi:cephalosporin hydroxylase
MNWAEANREFFASGVWRTLVDGRGRHLYKYPTDLIAYAELLGRVRPDVVVETGSAEGGSALWFSAFAEVISIDVAPPQFKHPGITFARGDSVARTTAEWVGEILAGRTCFVSLDSDHNADHVRRELDLYAPLVSVGSYLVVEDTAIDAYGLDADLYPGGGPRRAVDEFLGHTADFEVDPEPARFFLGMNPGGWLRRVA